MMNFAGLPIGAWFRCPAYSGLFLKVTARSAYSVQQRAVAKMQANELVENAEVEIKETEWKLGTK
jgi:hypothetical protein